VPAAKQRPQSHDPQEDRKRIPEVPVGRSLDSLTPAEILVRAGTRAQVFPLYYTAEYRCTFMGGAGARHRSEGTAGVCANWTNPCVPLSGHPKPANGGHLKTGQ
jgi:hypothetical protein